MKNAYINVKNLSIVKKNIFRFITFRFPQTKCDDACATKLLCHDIPKRISLLGFYYI